MRYTFLIVITLIPILLFGQVPSGIDTNYGYEEYLKVKYDSVDNLLNKYYKEWISFDSTGILRETQRAWIKYRDLNTSLINSKNSIPYSNSKQVKYLVLYNMTDFRLNELKALFWNTQLDRTFKTNGMVKEIFFPKDIVNIIPAIKNSSNKSDLEVKNIIYFIHSDPSNRTCRSCGDFRVDKGLIPKSTLGYIYSIIESDFLSEPTKCGDRFDGVDKGNINERVEFDLTFEPISLKYNLITDIWIMMLNVGEIDGGKRYGFTKIHYFDKDGTTINCNLSGYPNETYIENNEIYIKMFVCDDYPCESGMIKLCKYDKLKHEIIFVKDLGRQEQE